LAEKPTTETGQHTGAREETVRESGLPEKVSQLRRKLGRKAKQEARFRFYALYDRICRKDVLEAAWECVRRNRGAAGVGGKTIAQIEKQAGGAQSLIAELQRDLRHNAYRGTQECSRHTNVSMTQSLAGRMFWFPRKRLPGSYFAFTAARRA
jgi:hypothetical protein